MYFDIWATEIKLCALGNYVPQMNLGPHGPIFIVIPQTKDNPSDTNCNLEYESSFSQSNFNQVCILFFHLTFIMQVINKICQNDLNSGIGLNILLCDFWFPFHTDLVFCGKNADVSCPPLQVKDPTPNYIYLCWGVV